MSTPKDFLEFDHAYKDATFVLVPAPMEMTVSYGHGTDAGPQAILDCINQLETYDVELKKEAITKLVHTMKPVIPDSKDPGAYVEKLRKVVSKCVADGKIPVVLGGEHSLSYGVFKGIADHKKGFSVLHFDAHLDLRQSYENSIYSHASVIKRMWDHPEDIKNIVAVGIRSVSVEESIFVSENKRHSVFYAHEFYKQEHADKINSLLGKDLYITFDIDALDPSIMPSTGTPEPGGLGWYQTLEILRKAIRGRNIVGMDIVELAPDKVNHYSQFTAAKLLYKMLAYVSQEAL